MNIDEFDWRTFMKIEKLTDNKIRIILNIDDLAKKNIDVHSIIKNSDGTQAFFRNILKEAQKQVGFDIEDSRVLIEAFLSSEGFFILTFTKISNSQTQYKTAVHRPKAKIKSIDFSFETAIYEFSAFSDICDFRTYLSNSKIKTIKNLAKNISLYEYSSKYFLVLSEINADFKDISLFYTLISEFAKLTSNSKSFVGKLSEYGNTIFKDKKDFPKSMNLSY